MSGKNHRSFCPALNNESATKPCICDNVPGTLLGNPCTKPDCDCLKIAMEKKGGMDVKSYPCLATQPFTGRKGAELLPCPFCGSIELRFSQEKSPDGTITWHHIGHGPNIRCSVSMMDANKDELAKRWNWRTYG